MKIRDVDGIYFISEVEDVLKALKSNDKKKIIIKLKDKSKDDVTLKFATEKECDEVYNTIINQIKIKHKK